MTSENVGIFNLGTAEQVGGLRRGDKGNITVTNLEGTWREEFPKKMVSYVEYPGLMPGFLWCDHTSDPSQAIIAAGSRKELNRLRELMLNPKVLLGEQSYDGSY